MSETPGPDDNLAPAFWRPFLVYTGSRIGVFAVLLGLLYGVGVRGLIVVLIAVVMSGILSYFLLDRQRAAFAAAVEARVQRRRLAAITRVSREDAIADQLIAEQQAQQNVSPGGPRAP